MSEWETPAFGIDDPEVQASESYGYNTSWWFFRQLTDGDADGADILRRLVAAVDQKELTYRVEGDTAGFNRSESWRRVLDLVEREGIAVDVQQLLRDHVLDSDDQAELDARNAARARYFDLEAAAGSWSLPLGLRRDMTYWRFEPAIEVIEDAAPLLELRDTRDSQAAAQGRVVSDLAETRFESAIRRSDLTDVADHLEDAIAALAALREADALLAEEPGLLGKIGGWGEDPSMILVDARASFDAEDFASAQAAPDAVADELAALEDQGRTRVTIAAGAAVALLLAIFVVIWRVRVRRRRRIPAPCVN